jgi:adenylate kinase
MRLILLGAPGAGKGTQASLLARHFNISKLSTGDMLREAAKKGDDFGNNLQKIMSTGGLVDDAIIIEIIKKVITDPKCANGFILDGFPRTVNQAAALEGMMLQNNIKLDCVVDLVVDYEVLAKRIAGRFSCKNCGEGYHDEYKPTKKKGVCDICSSTDFVRREDDKLETVAKRLLAYEQQTAPLIPYYKQKNLLQEIDGMLEMEQVQSQIRELFN